MRVLVTGAGGFIGGHLVRRLLRDGHAVRGADRKPIDEWHQAWPDAENLVADVARADAAAAVCAGMDHVYNLAADMGGMGFIEAHKADCMLSVLSSTNVLVGARDAGVGRFFFTSSACVYGIDRQRDPQVVALRESDAYPALPQDGYGWEKLFTERMCRHFTEDYGLATRVARLHNVYGPHGDWQGGREKAPAAVCRKVSEAQQSDDHRIRIWGDGQQTRSFMHIDDCIQGIRLIMDSVLDEPINLGSTELVSINDLVSVVEEIAGVRLERSYEPGAPQGVRGRNSDNTMIQAELGWEPSTKIRAGLEDLYAWIYDQVAAARRGR